MRKLFAGIGSFLQTPIGVIITTNVVWHIVVLAFGIPFNYFVSIFLLIVDIAAAFYLRDRLIYFFAQFVLPIQNSKYRDEIYARVNNFETGSRGPALFIKNGRVIEHPGEREKRGPGLIVLDTASAAVLRTDTEIRDTIGPGIKFTEGNEYIAGSVDLRAQWQFIGPLANDQLLINPLSSAKANNEVQSRRQQTNGLTRDGFEITPTISIKFRIKRPPKNGPTESGVTSQYQYNEDAVRNAITREVVQLGTADSSKPRMPWNKLPAHLVVNIWREYIRKFKLSDLFTSSGISGLQTIEDMINKRVKQLAVVALDDTGIPTGERLDSLEFLQLDARGLEILEVRIHNVTFEPEIEKQHIEQWSTEWLSLAKKEAGQIKEKEALLETVAREDASKNFARITSKQFTAKPTQPQENPFKTLQLLISPLREFLLSESHANSEMEAEIRKLNEVWKWLLDNNPDGGNSSKMKSGDEQL